MTLTAAEQAAVGKPHTKNLMAFTYYGQALMAQDAGNWKEARDLFLKALKEDPNFALAREGASGSPGPNAPSIASLSSMTAASIAGSLSSAIDGAQSAQAEADSQASEAQQGGGGGG